jgi:acyl-CoA synthetase (AMP-forming)/AMP-acid ligase II
VIGLGVDADRAYAGIDSFGLDDVLEQHARVRPQALAAVCNGARITWQQMHARCQALADELSAAGLGAGDRVLWWGQNCHRLLEVLFAVARLGAVVCPANWRQTSSELRFVLDDSCPAVVIWQVQEIGDIACTVRGQRSNDALWIQHDAAGPGS